MKEEGFAHNETGCDIEYGLCRRIYNIYFSYTTKLFWYNIMVGEFIAFLSNYITNNSLIITDLMLRKYLDITEAPI